MLVRIVDTDVLKLCLWQARSMNV